MSLRSLHVRLLVAAIISTSAALVIAGFGLVNLFGHHVERTLDRQLETFISELIGGIEPDGKGGIVLTRSLSDPRFDEPLSGLYWQIQDDAHRILIRSRSLWDDLLDLPRDELALNVVHRHESPGPGGQHLLVREQQVIVLPETLAYRLRVAVAIDRGDLIGSRAAFSKDLWPYLLVLGVTLLLAAGWQVHMGLAPLDQVRRGVLAIRTGHARRLPPGYPDELQPLVSEINDLLSSRDQAVEDAQAWSGDLAHGLKTPLTALSADAQRLRDLGQDDMADGLEELADGMRQRVDRELIRARLRNPVARAPQRTPLGKTLAAVVNTLKRVPAGENLDWRVDIPEGVEVTMPVVDLAELLGNVLDNAVKWAEREIRVVVTRDREAWRVLVEDDGPGVPETELARLGERGLRLDERTVGTGLGLAIVRDICAAYACRLEFSGAASGGLAVAVYLPSTD